MMIKAILDVLYLLLLVCLPLAAIGAELSIPPASSQTSPDDAVRTYNQGAFESAVRYWEEVAEKARLSSDPAGQADALLGAAQAYEKLGYLPKSVDALLGALKIIQPTGDQERAAAVLSSLGSILQRLGSFKDARQYLDSSLELADKTGRKDIRAGAFNNLGNLLEAESHHAEAIDAYRKSFADARESGLLLLAGSAAINAARAASIEKDHEKMLSRAREAQEVLSTVPDTHDKAFALIGLGQLLASAHHESKPPNPEIKRQAYNALNAGLAIARAIRDIRSESYALGYIGWLYENDNRLNEALTLTNQAIFLAQQVGAPELQYRWYWQHGRILKAQSRAEEAIKSYRQAVYHLDSMRQDMSTNTSAGSSSYLKVFAPVYFELADLLLQQTTNQADQQHREDYLLEARSIIEKSKTAELQDYFQDGCVTAYQSKIKQVNRAAARTAFIYPILFKDRLELLVSLENEIKKYTVAEPAENIINEVRNFRILIEKRSTNQYRRHAKKLYQWLIAPLEPDLQARKVDTLVFVPDGALRTIPMSALHDGRQFLVQRYAIAISPGLSLTDPKPIDRKSTRMLINGITQSVQGFAPLANVNTEIESILKLQDSKVLMDKDFVVGEFDREINSKPYNIVHIASHGQFEGDVRHTFIMAHDKKISMDNLEQIIAPSRYRNEPIELLTLSACQTAVGDDRAALGLAGIAVKAGARSSLASLWFINDQFSASLTPEFYRHLKDPNVSKAQALQMAQTGMIEGKRFRHPGYWAAFVLIGNWL